jgi:small nuclear ribonucleoprotein E
MPGMALQNLIFRFLQSRQKVQIWLFEQTDLRVEGRIIVRPHPPR